jgi:hypothetical protein
VADEPALSKSEKVQRRKRGRPRKNDKSDETATTKAEPGKWLVGVRGRLGFVDVLTVLVLSEVGVESLSTREENRGQHRAPVKRTLNQEPVGEPEPGRRWRVA